MDKVGCYVMSDSEDWLVGDLVKRSLVLRLSLRSIPVKLDSREALLLCDLFKRRLVVG